MDIQKFIALAKSQTPSNLRWRHRRKLIYIGFFLGVFMILFGIATFWWDRTVSVEAIVSGTAIIVVLLTAYTAGATYDDAKHMTEDYHE